MQLLRMFEIPKKDVANIVRNLAKRTERGAQSTFESFPGGVRRTRYDSQVDFKYVTDEWAHVEVYVDSFDTFDLEDSGAFLKAVYDEITKSLHGARISSHQAIVPMAEKLSGAWHAFVVQTPQEYIDAMLLTVRDFEACEDLYDAGHIAYPKQVVVLSDRDSGQYLAFLGLPNFIKECQSGQ